MWIGQQQRKKLHAGRQTAQETIELRKGAIGIGGLAQCLKQGGHQCRQPFTRPLTAHRAHPAMMPAADGGGDMSRFAKPHAGKRFERLRVFLHPCEHQTAALGGERGLALKQAAVMTADGLQALCDRNGEGRCIGKTHEAGDVVQVFFAFRQGMGLLIFHHLQAVFEFAQEEISGAQFRLRLLRDQAARGKRGKGFERCTPAQVGIAAAQYQLLGLHKEFDLANAATAELDVVTGDRDLAVAFMGVNLPLDRMNIFDCREIEILAPDEGLHRLQKTLPRFGIAGTGTRLDHGRAFPVLAHRFVIMLRRIG